MDPLRELDDHASSPRDGFITNYPPYARWMPLDHEAFTIRCPLSIYIHIPFCAQKCSYCYYKVLTGTQSSERNEYVEALCKEMRIASDNFGLNRRQISSIYIGGGTPTLLTEVQLSKIVESINQNFTLGEPEFTVESEPATLTQSTANALRNSGVNRISLGVQSFNDEILRMTHRHDTRSRNLRAIDIAKGAVPVVNIDLLSGLKGETHKTWSQSVDQAIATNVESITIYKMEIYSNSEYYRDLRNNAPCLPSDSEEMDFMKHAQEQLAVANYVPWSFFTFTKRDNYPHKHSQNIWQGGDCYALGVSSFGVIGNCLFQNTSDWKEYVRSLASGRLAIKRGYHLPALDAMMRDVLLGTKLVQFDLQRFSRRYGVALQDVCSSALGQLLDSGLVTMSDTHVTRTDEGILYADYIGKLLAENLRSRLTHLN